MATPRFSVNTATSVFEKNKEDLIEKVYKARRAGMKADHFYSLKPEGSDAVLRAVIPKAKLTGNTKIRIVEEHGMVYSYTEFPLEYQGKPFLYRIPWRIAKEPKGSVVAVAGEDLLEAI